MAAIAARAGPTNAWTWIACAVAVGVIDSTTAIAAIRSGMKRNTTEPAID